MTPALDRRAPQPMYHQLKQKLVELIEREGLVPGDLVPGEHRLCEMFDVSRTVVRQALAQLEHEGVVTRVRGKGTFVAPQKVSETLVHTLHGLHEEMSARGAIVTSRVFRQRLEAAPDEAAEALGIAPGTRAAVIERLRFVNGEPWSLSTTWIPEWASEVALAADLRERSLYGVLADAGIHAVRGVRSAEASVADPERAKLLDVAVGGPLLVLRSVAFDERDRPMEFFVAYHRGDRSRFEFQLRADEESTATLRHTGVEAR